MLTLIQDIADRRHKVHLSIYRSCADKEDRVSRKIRRIVDGRETSGSYSEVGRHLNREAVIKPCSFGRDYRAFLYL